MANNTQLVPGSISAIAQAQNKSIAETFMNADCIVIVDTSGSMGQHDSRGGQSRYDVACAELAQLQAGLPGKIAVIAFSNGVQFCPSGVPYNFGCGTDMAQALQFAKIADIPGMRFILISDGQPDEPSPTLSIAKQYKNKIDVIYVGPESDPGGRVFLEQLAAATGGQAITVDCAKELQQGITLLLGQGQP